MSEYKIKTPTEKIREDKEYKTKLSERNIKNALNFLEQTIIVTDIPGECIIKQTQTENYFKGFTFNIDKNLNIISMEYDYCLSDDFKLNWYECALVNSILAAAGYILSVVVPPKKFGIFSRKPYLLIKWSI